MDYTRHAIKTRLYRTNARRKLAPSQWWRHGWTRAYSRALFGLAAYDLGSAVASCACGRAYALDDWQRLRLCGVQHIGDGGPDVEIRNCRCGSSIGRDVMP